MKAQSTLVNEILLFILGMFITAFLAYSMGSIEKRVENISTSDHMNEISDYLSASVLKVAQSGENSSLMLKMKPYYGRTVYRMRFVDGNLVVSLFDDERINVTREIFNISSGKIIIGEVTSSSRYILITNSMTKIEMKTWKGD